MSYIFKEHTEADYSIGPQLEILSDFKDLDPQGKRVLSIAAYGGYPLHFLTHKAKEVVALDNSPHRVRQNRFLRGLILNGSFGDNVEALWLEIDQEPAAFGQYFNESSKRLFESCRLDESSLFESGLPESYEEFRRWRSNFIVLQSDLEAFFPHRKELSVYYPHLVDQATFERVKQKVSWGRYRIIEGDLLTFLEGTNEVFDIVYGSSVRHWVLNFEFLETGKTICDFQEQFDRRLSEAVEKRVSNDGIFVDVLIGSPNYRLVPTGRLGYWHGVTQQKRSIAYEETGVEISYTRFLKD